MVSPRSQLKLGIVTGLEVTRGRDKRLIQRLTKPSFGLCFSLFPCRLPLTSSSDALGRDDPCAPLKAAVQTPNKLFTRQIHIKSPS
jgi:hypothetical protein